MENLYKNNLLVLSNLNENESIYYSENRICKEDRYFGSLRYGNNNEKIISIINISFLHYYNILLITDNDNEEIKNLLNNSIIGLKNFKIYTQNNNICTENISKLIELFNKYIDDLENNKYIKTKENIKNVQDNIDIIKKQIEENNEKTETKTENVEEPKKCNFIFNLVIGIRDTITNFFTSIYSHIFIY